MKPLPSMILSPARLRQAAAQIVLGVLAIALAATLEASGVPDSDTQWRFLTQDTPYSIRYYERDPAPHDSPDLRRVWTRTVPTAEGNPQVREIRSLWEIDCEKRAFRSLRTVILYRDGSSEETATARQWTEARSEIWVGRLSEILCREASGSLEPKDPTIK